MPLDRWQRHVVDTERPWRAIFIAGADIDSDGLNDIITGGWWYRNPGNPTDKWERRTLGDPLYNMAAVFDFDHDGHVDVLGTAGKGSEASSTFVWARNDGRSSFHILNNIDQAQGDFLQGVAVGALGDGGRLGIALSWHKGGSGVQMLTIPDRPSRAQWTWHRVVDESQDEQISAGDIDGQMGLDLLLGTKWLRNGRDRWTLHQVTNLPGNPDRNRLADMNGDGRLDAVVGYEAINVPGKLAWYEQQEMPLELWKEHLIAEVIGPMSVDVADLDRDGDPDVVVGEHNYENPESAKLIVFENADGKATTWKPHVVHTGDEHHDGAVLVDIEGDGDLDIISIGWQEPEVWLYENRAIDRSRED